MAALSLAGAALAPDPSGALVWPDEGVVVVADLHFEKGSAFARRGVMLPPYDTAATLARLEDLLRRLRPGRVVCLGDSFHDRTAAGRMEPADRGRLTALVGAVEWIWIVGNHDPDPPVGMGGRAAAELRLGPLVFRHEAVAGAAGEVSGHLHPVAAVRVTGRRVRGRCFVTDGAKLILPAFGAYAGGLNVLDPAVSGLLRPEFEAHILSGDRVHRFPRGRLAPDSIHIKNTEYKDPGERRPFSGKRNSTDGAPSAGEAMTNRGDRIRRFPRNQ